MKKCVVVSDSFKGTLSSSEICGIASECFAQELPDCSLCLLPVADGGEGTVECFVQACGAEPVAVDVSGPYFEPITAVYAKLGSDTAVIEMAAAAGLTLVGDQKNPAKTTTYGVGQLIRHAVEQGCTKVILGLGGSATNDGGCGCAAALGVIFTDAAGEAFVPVGETLNRIKAIDRRAAVELLHGVELILMSDVKYPMHGENGAAYIFGPQKGADAQMVRFLDEQLKKFDCIVKQQLGKQIADRQGAGAAGALGAGCMAFFDAEMRSGIETALELVGLDRHLEDCDLVITGEGQLDRQSLNGKVISGVLEHTCPRGIPTIAIVGAVEDEIYEQAYALGLSAVFSINRRPEPFEQSRLHSHDNYRRTLTNLLRLLRAYQF
ncbi:glycerate kinase [Agathobaculum massiliense]|uniref:glycerate kinase family protein n=1 Tax=Agathobaculum massiliense TaxID=3014267 RepID=UPI0036F27949